MSADVATIRSLAETSELTRRALGTTFGLLREILVDPSTLDDIPDGVTLVLVPTADPDLAAAEVEQGLAALRRGDDVYFRHVPSDPPLKRVGEESWELDRAYRRVWERLRAGEIGGDDAVEESLAVLRGASTEAVRIASRRANIRSETITDQTGVPGSPAIAGILAVLEETDRAMNSAGRLPDADDFERRMNTLIADLKAKIGRD